MTAVARPLAGRLLRAGRRAFSRVPLRFGSLRRLTPVSRHFGYDRGLPVDRHYIERFLEDNAAVVAGHVLEIGDSAYTRRSAGAESPPSTSSTSTPAIRRPRSWATWPVLTTYPPTASTASSSPRPCI